LLLKLTIASAACDWSVAQSGTAKLVLEILAALTLLHKKLKIHFSILGISKLARFFFSIPFLELPGTILHLEGCYTSDFMCDLHANHNVTRAISCAICMQIPHEIARVTRGRLHVRIHVRFHVRYRVAICMSALWKLQWTRNRHAQYANEITRVTSPLHRKTTRLVTISIVRT
jgi:hypothetical protein